MYISSHDALNEVFPTQPVAMDLIYFLSLNPIALPVNVDNFLKPNGCTRCNLNLTCSSLS